jgi:hypothetical protein
VALMTRALALLLVGAGIAAAQPPPPTGPPPPPPDAPAPPPAETPAPAPQPPPPPRNAADALREGNAAASAGDWARVSTLVEPLVKHELPIADRAEAHRLAALAAFFQNRTAQAETHFVEYLKIDLDAQLDPALYPPEVLTFFNDVKLRHAAELRARRPKQRRFVLLNLIPPGGQIQNGQKKKAYVVGGLLGGLAIANVTSYLVLRSWCKRVGGPDGSSALCDEDKDRSSAATQLRALNIVSGVGLILTYAYGVYDGFSGYRRHARELQPYVTSTTTGGGVLGITGSF